MDKPQVTIYSDGGAKPNPNGKGGWAAILIYGQHQKELSGGEPHTTNNRMELTAAIMALEALKQPCVVEFHTDSEYLKNGITKWLSKWVKSGWMTAEYRTPNGKIIPSKPVENQDLWDGLHEATQRHEITWKWVKGHAGHELNERAHQLATLARESLRQK